MKLSEDILLRMKRNDPEITSVDIHFENYGEDSSSFDAYKLDWAAEASSIRDNTHLKTLTISGMMGPPELSFSSHGISLQLRDEDIGNMTAFFEAIARNSSVTSLIVNHLDPALELMFERLAPIFWNLREFELFNTNWDDQSALSFVSALEKCEYSTLQHFQLRCHRTKDDIAAKLLEALHKHCNLMTLSWESPRGFLEEKSIQKLTELLNGQQSQLEKLEIKSGVVEQSLLRRSVRLPLAKVLAKNTKLKILHLECINWFTRDEWENIIPFMSNASCVLTSLNLRGACFLDGEMSALLDALTSNSTLQVLDLSFIDEVSTELWLSLPSSLNNMPLEELYLHGNEEYDEPGIIWAAEITGEVVASLAELLVNNTTLYNLQFGDNEGVDDEVFLSFARALKRNRTLKSVCFDSYYRHGRGCDQITYLGWNALIKALCDNSSIAATFNSNHTLERVSDWQNPIHSTAVSENIPRSLFDILQLNSSSCNKFDVARRKIMRTHFSDCTSMHIFTTDMDWKVLPQALSWMAGDGTLGQSVLYHLLRSLPSLLFGFERREGRHSRMA